MIEGLDYMASLPNSYEEGEFIYEFRDGKLGGKAKPKSFWNMSKEPEITEVTVMREVNGQEFPIKCRQAKTKTFVKRTDVVVVVRDNGTGKYTVDGHEIDCYRFLTTR